MIRVLIPLLVLLSVVSCASTSGVFRVGDNTYRVTTRATWELGGRVGAMRMAMEQATETCAAQGKKLLVISSKDDYGHFQGGIVDLTFACEQAFPLV